MLPIHGYVHFYKPFLVVHFGFAEPATIPDIPASSHTEAVVVYGNANEASSASVIDDTVAGVAVSKPSNPPQENVLPIVETPVKEDAKKITYASMVRSL